jgi:hypothetical protein
MILLTVIPLSVSVALNSPRDGRPLFVFRDAVPANAAENLALLSPEPPVALEDVMCFDSLLVTSTFSQFVDTEDLLSRSIHLDARPLRRRLPTVATDQNIIVVSENLWGVLGTPIREKFPDANLVKLATEETMTKAIRKVGPASVFIGDHIASLVHVLWMNGGAVVIDATPGEFVCTEWGETLAHRATLRYAAVFSGNCTCRKLDCYPSAPIPPSGNFSAVLEYVRRARLGAI